MDNGYIFIQFYLPCHINQVTFLHGLVKIEKLNDFHSGPAFHARTKNYIHEYNG